MNFWKIEDMRFGFCTNKVHQHLCLGFPLFMLKNKVFEHAQMSDKKENQTYDDSCQTWPDFRGFRKQKLMDPVFKCSELVLWKGGKGYL